MTDGHPPEPAAAPAGEPGDAQPRSRRRGLRMVFWLVVAAAVIAVLAGVPAVYVFGPLLAFGILRIGLATFNSLEAGAAHIPDAPPVPVDPQRERVVYSCGGCGAEVLLLARGTPVPPRHCGERMEERRLIARDGPPGLR